MGTLVQAQEIAAAEGRFKDLRALAVPVVASSHKLQDGQHDTPDGYVLVKEDALLALAGHLAKTR